MKFLLCFLFVLLIWGACYLDRIKITYEKWVDKKFPIWKGMHFTKDGKTREMMGEVYWNDELRSWRSTLMILLIVAAVYIGWLLIMETFFNWTYLDLKNVVVLFLMYFYFSTNFWRIPLQIKILLSAQD